MLRASETEILNRMPLAIFLIISILMFLSDVVVSKSVRQSNHDQKMAILGQERERERERESRIKLEADHGRQLLAFSDSQLQRHKLTPRSAHNSILSKPTS